MPQLVDDNGNPIKSQLVDDSGNPIIEPKFDELKGVNFENPPEPEPPKIRLRGSTFDDPNATWWDKAKDITGIILGPSSPDAVALGDFEQNVVSPAVPRIPGPRAAAEGLEKLVTPSSPTSTLGQAYKDVVGGGILGIGETLADPRALLLPKIFEFGAPPRGMRSPSRFGNAEVWDENIPFDRGTKNVTPDKPGQLRLGSGDTTGIKLRPYGSELPPNTSRRFLGNAEVRSPLGSKESEIIPPVKSTTDIKEKGPGWVDVEDPSQKRKLRFTKEGTLVDPITGEDDIALARTKTGGIKIGADVRRSAQELTTGYSGDLPSIMVREGLQNAIDAVRHLGDKGEVTVNIDNPYGGDATLVITDNGKGMTRKELETVFSDFHSSGKTTEGGATGGKGVGKASYMLGGEHFTVETITKEGPNIVKHTMQGTPEEFMTEVKPKTELMPHGTPTGTKIITSLNPEQTGYSAKNMVEEVMKYSRGIPTKIKTKYGTNSWDRFTDNPYTAELTHNDTPIATRDFGHSDVDLTIPHTVSREDKPRNAIRLRVLNNGMYQYSGTHYLEEETKGLPDEVLINVRPKVEEGSKEYPFPVQREGLKEKTEQEIKNYLDETLINPRRVQAQSKLKEIYENLAVIPTEGKRFRNSILFDPGDRLSSTEKSALVNSPYIKQLTTYLDDFIEEALSKSGNTEWSDKLEGVGIVLDPNMHGVHIPNPESKGKKSIILINPFSHAQYEEGPFDTAIATAVTTLHELAHIGREDPSSVVKFNREDLMHPDVGLFMQTYYKEVQDHGGLDMGHGFGFVKRLGEIYAKTGIEQPIQFATDFTRLLSGTDARGNLAYTPEFQDLLRIYDESRGRAAVTEDYLSGTGVKSATPTGRRRGTQSSAGGNGGGVPRKPIIDRIGQYQSGKTPPPDPGSLALRQQLEDDGVLIKAAGFFKGMKATADLGPVLRQGVAYTGRPFWWKAFRQQFISYASEDGHQRFLNELKTDPLNQPNWRDQGGKATSYYDLAKVDLTHTSGPLIGQEEAIMGLDLVEKPIAWVNKKTGLNLPNPPRASNRAYSDAILSLRRGATQVLVDNYNRLYESTKKGAKNEKELNEAETYNPKNPLVAQLIGNEVNRSTGRGRLSTPELKLPNSRFLGPASGAKLARSFSVESNADVLNVALFSPRLFSSRIQNINKFFNPISWAKADPVMRKEYLKQILSIAGLVVAGNSLMSLFGAKTGDEPTSPDYMKSRFSRGKKGVSVDFTGGYGRFATLGSRLSSRQVTTGAGNRFKIGQPPIGDAVSLIEDFGEGLASPVMQTAMQFLNQKEFGNKPLDMTNPNPFENSMGKSLMTPMITQDLYELLQEDPSLVPLIFPDALGAPLTVYGR